MSERKSSGGINDKSYRPLIEVAGSALRFNLHEGQWRAWNSTARIVLVLAGAQSGKTSFGPLWLRREIARCGSGDYIAATASYDLFKLKMLPEMLKLFCEYLASAGEAWEYRTGDGLIVNKPGDVRIILRSAKSDGGLESTTAKACWCDEWGQNSVGLDSQEAVERRLALHQGRQLITTTPYNLGWMYQRLYQPAIGGDEGIDLIQFNSLTNPAFPEAEYERQRKRLQGWRFAMFYQGKMVRPAGLIYTAYDDSYAVFEDVKVPNRNVMAPGPGRYVEGGCLVRPFVIPKHWLRHGGVDPGAVNTAVLWVAEDPVTGNFYAYREYLGPDSTFMESAKQVLEYKEPLGTWVGGSASEEERRLEWSRGGVPLVRPVISDVETGIDRTAGLFKARKFFVFDTLTSLRSQLGTYSRELDAAGLPTERIADKQTFHMIDALRYIGSELASREIARHAVEQAYADDTRQVGSMRKRFIMPIKEDPDEY